MTKRFFSIVSLMSLSLTCRIFSMSQNKARFFSLDREYVHKRLEDPLEELYSACMRGNTEKAKELIAGNVSPEKMSSRSGSSPLHATAMWNKKNTLKEILTVVTSCDVHNDEGYTALHYAAITGFKRIAQLLITHGASIEKTGFDGQTPLHSAAYKGHKKIVKMLLWHNAPIDAKKKNNGKTPLHLAVDLGHKEITKLLITRSFFLPTTVNTCSPLKDLCFKGDLNEGMLNNLALDLINFDANFIAEYVSLRNQKKIMEFLRRSHNLSQLNALIEAHCKRHLRKIHETLAIKDTQTDMTALDFAHQKKNHALIFLLSHVYGAKSFEALNEKIQKIMINNIRNRLIHT